MIASVCSSVASIHVWSDVPSRMQLIAGWCLTARHCWPEGTPWLEAHILTGQRALPSTAWDGVRLEGLPRHVTGLDLRDLGLNGEIPAALSGLTNLVYIDFRYNQLTGEIPTQLASLSNLRQLSLALNELTGTIPTQLGNLSNLDTLDLAGNQLSGSIPPQLGDLSNLTGLGLWGNQLTGAIPTKLGNLTNLRVAVPQRQPAHRVHTRYSARRGGQRLRRTRSRFLPCAVVRSAIGERDDDWRRSRETPHANRRNRNLQRAGQRVCRKRRHRRQRLSWQLRRQRRRLRLHLRRDSQRHRHVVTVDIAAGVAQDSDGNGNTAAMRQLCWVSHTTTTTTARSAGTKSSLPLPTTCSEACSPGPRWYRSSHSTCSDDHDPVSWLGQSAPYGIRGPVVRERARVR